MSIGLGAMFSVVLGWALYMGLDISCGCFSSSATGTISYMTLVRAMAIMLFSGLAYLAVIFLQPYKKQLQP